MSTAIRPRPGIMDIALYVGGQSQVEGVRDVVKLSSNENPFGPSEKAMQAFRRCAHSLHRYPSSDHSALRAAIGQVHGIDPEQIICGAGSDEIITFLCQAYAGEGDEVLYSEHGFLMYRISAQAAGATPVEAPEIDRTASVDALLAAANERTRLVFLANPNNPTGTMLPPDEVERLAAHLPRQALLVLDAAYAEYADDTDGGVSLVGRRKNVVMTRTFSKMYGLGGLRVGWAYGPRHVIDVLNRLRGPFNLSTAQLETAEAALGDVEYLARCRADNTRLRSWLTGALNEIGVGCDDSQANFVLARFASPEEAAACNEMLRAEGLIVREVGSYKLPHCLRITVGDEPSCRRVVHVIAQFRGHR